MHLCSSSNQLLIISLLTAGFSRRTEITARRSYSSRDLKTQIKFDIYCQHLERISRQKIKLAVGSLMFPRKNKPMEVYLLSNGACAGTETKRIIGGGGS